MGIASMLTKNTPRVLLTVFLNVFPSFPCMSVCLLLFKLNDWAEFQIYRYFIAENTLYAEIFPPIPYNIFRHRNYMDQQKILSAKRLLN